MANDTIEKFIQALEVIPEFDQDVMVLRLQTACTACPNMDTFRSAIDLPHTDQKGTEFFDLDCKTIVSDLGLASSAYGMSLLADKYEFHSSVDQPKCSAAIKSDVTNMVPYLFGEHINQTLAKGSVSPLATLRNNSQIVEAFKNLIRTPVFIHKVGKNITYGMALFFVDQYFTGGIPPPSLETPPLEIGTHRSLSNLIDVWMCEYQEDDDAKRALQIAQFSSPCGHHTLLGANKDFVPADEDIVTFIKALGHERLNKTITQSQIPDEWKEQYQTLSKTVYQVWELKATTFQSAVSTAIYRTRVSDDPHSKSDTYCHGGPAASCTTITSHWIMRTTTYGDDVAGWVDTYSKTTSYFSGKPSSNRSVVERIDKGSTTSGGGGISVGCFTPETQVLTKTGPVPIAELREGMHILTKSGVKQYGICSDEVVKQPTLRKCEVSGKEIPTSFYGFNEYEPFFSANHVFYTTTGLRAIDPISAQLENPWLKAGRLQVGHRVLQTRDGGATYEYITIESITCGVAPCEYMYGVHLREGLRSYHANGFLVHLNYPEITTASVGKIISSLPRRQQQSILLSLKELRPIFARFGTAAVFDAFHQEQQRIRKPVPLKGESKPLHPRVNQMCRTWRLEPVNATGGQYPFPSLGIVDNVLFIGGEHCLRASMDDRMVRWSRPIVWQPNPDEPRQELWEHGACVFTSTAHRGNGVLWLDFNAEPEGVSGTVFSFRARPVSTSRSEPVEEDSPQMSPTAMLVSTGRPTAMQLSQADDKRDDDDDFPYDLSYDPSTPITKDPKEYKSTSMVPLFQIISTDLDVQGYTLPHITVPVFDELTKVLSDKIKAATGSTADVPSLYSVKIEQNKDNNTEYTLTLDYPEVVYKNSDNYSVSAADPYHNLTFKKIGSDVTLPTLIKTLSFVLSFDAMSLHGSVTEFDPGKDGEFGNKYNMTGKYHESASALRLNAIDVAHTAMKNYIDATNENDGLITSAHTEPAFATTAALSSTTELTIEALMDLDMGTKWSDGTIHEATQTLIFNSMLYHINDDDRTNFFGEQKPIVPDALPEEMADGLADNVKTFLKDKYGPAYICQRLMSVDDVTKSQWRRKFTAEQQKKILYFWTGKGDGSLYKCPEYNLLNEIAAGSAVRKLHPSLLDYINDAQPDDKGLVGGKKWATTLYAHLSTPPMINKIKVNRKAGGSDFSRYCNFLYALDGDPSKPDKIAQMVVKSQHNDTTKCTYTGLGYTKLITSDEDLYQWLYDAMAQLISWVIDPNSQCPDNVRQSLIDDVNNLRKEFKIDTTQSAIDQAIAILNQVTAGLEQMTALLKAYNSKADPNGRGWGQASKIAKAVTWAEGSPRFMASMKGIMILGIVANFIGQSLSMWKDWGNLSATQRAQLIVDTLLTACQVAGKAFEMWDYICKARAKPEPTGPEDPNETIAGRTLDKEQETIMDQPLDDDEKAQVGSWENQQESSINEGLPTSNSAQGVGNNNEVPINPEDPPEPQKIAEAPESQRAFNTGENWCRGAAIVCSAALTVIMCVKLGQSWGNLTLAQKILETAQVIQQGLSVIVDAAGLVSEGLFAFGEIGEAAFVAFSSVLAWAGAILVVLGVVIMICLMIFNAAQEPPLTPVEQWIQDHGEGFCDSLPAPPDPKLHYDVTNPVIYNGSGTKISVTIKNSTSSEVTVSQASINFWTGPDKSTLTTEAFYAVKKAGNTLMKGQVEVSDGSVVAAIQTKSQPVGDGKQYINRQQFLVQKPHDTKTNPNNDLILAPGETVVVNFIGTLSNEGPCTMEVDEITTGQDTLPVLFSIEKKSG